MIGTVERNQLVLSHDRRIPCVIRTSERARRMRMTLSPEGGLTVTVPLGVSQDAALDFIRTSLPWIERTLFKLSLRQRRREPEGPRVFPPELFFPLTGERFVVRYEWRDVCWTGAKEETGELLVSGRVLDPDAVHEALYGYLLRKADTVLTPQLRSLADEYGFRVGKISFRIQRGRWGSCARARDISLNAQLLFLTPEEVRYVLIHELCHTREMNHSARFWREVARICPDHVRIRKQIKQRRPEIWR